MNSERCRLSYVHAVPEAGIHGRKDSGARSVVMSGSDEYDDKDDGETL